MNTFTLFTINPNSEFGAHAKEIKIRAKSHIQHIYNETYLQGVSFSGLKRIAATFDYEDTIYTLIAGKQVKVAGYNG